jgi:hypothetical protein
MERKNADEARLGYVGPDSCSDNVFNIQNQKEVMKQLFSVLVLWFYALGTIGGIGYAVYCEAYLIAVAVLVLALMAFPTARSYYKYLVG